MIFTSTTLQGVCQQLMRYILFLMRYITRNNVKCSVYKKVIISHNGYKMGMNGNRWKAL